jgi:L-arabonate dehydrase
MDDDSERGAVAQRWRPAEWPRKLRSQDWFGGTTKDNFMHRSWMKNQGLAPDAFDGRPIIGICNTWSELTPCNAHLRDLAGFVKRGIYEAGGVPFEFPVFSTGESNLRPTAMLFRNLASMDVEEAIRGNPVDGVVLLAGCDKTTPALLMGAASCDLPSLLVSGGPMLNGKFRGQDVGSGTAIWRFADAVRTGSMSLGEFAEAEQGMARSAGHCMTMGTASTMASMAEALGIALPENAAIPAVDARRRVLMQMAGRRIVELVKHDLRPSHVLTREAFENAVRTCAAIGGSTNAVLHLIAIAGRLDVPLTLEDWDRWGRDVPTLVDLQPAGRFLMEDFYYAGGLPAVLRRLGEMNLLHRDALTVSGRSIWDNVAAAPTYNAEVIRGPESALVERGGIAVLRGNLARNGAVIKVAAATPRLTVHRGRAVVFDSIEDYRARVDDPRLDVDENSVLVLRNCGPCGYPGMAEVGNMGIPAKLLQRGVTDMVRISDARMSGTAFGTVILHVAPEATVGGALAIVQDGDEILLDVPNRRIHLDVSDQEIARRLGQWRRPQPEMDGGYQKLYVDTVLQADRGADLGFLVGRRGHKTPRPSH